MKKSLFLVLILMFTLIFTVIGFAATDTVDVPDANAPGAAPDTTTDMYPTEDFQDGDTPEGSPIEAFEEEIVPLATTGGIPAEIFYVAGGLCILLAIVVSKKK